MGKIGKGVELDTIKIKVPRTSGKQPCGPELVGFLSCLDQNGGDDGQCRNAREALHTCMEAASASGFRRTHKAAINFHLKTVRVASRIFFLSLAPDFSRHTHPLLTMYVSCASCCLCSFCAT